MADPSDHPRFMAEAPPLSQSYADDVITRHLVLAAAWAAMLIGGTIGGLLLLEPTLQPVRVALNFMAALVGALSLWLVQLQRWKAAAHLLLWGVWVSVSLVAARNGGVNGANLFNYPVLIVLTGWLLGERVTLVLVGLTALVLLGLILGDAYGILRHAPAPNPVVSGVYLGGILAFTAAATLLSRRSYVRRVQEVQQTANHLAASEAALTGSGIGARVLRGSGTIGA